MLSIQGPVAPSGSSMVQKIGARGAGEYLSFRLGTKEYGVSILVVQEIRGCDRSLRMVRGPRHLLGVLDVHGGNVPIIDLRIRFGTKDAAYHGQIMTIIVNVGDRNVGLVVDEVSDVVFVRSSDIKVAPDIRGPIGAAHVIGVATVVNGHVERTLILLEIEALMARTAMGLPDAPSV